MKFNTRLSKGRASWENEASSKPAELNRVFYFALICSLRDKDKTHHYKKYLEYLHIAYRIFAYSIYIKHDAYFSGWEGGNLVTCSVPGAFHTALNLPQPKDARYSLNL